MFVSIGYFAFWCIMRGADVARPSALHRGYVSIWLFTLSWAVLIIVAASEDRYEVASGYIFVFLQSSLFLTTLIAVLELFALPDVKKFWQQVRDDDEGRDHLEGVPSADDLITPGPGESDGADSDNEAAEDEEEMEPPSILTPLLGRPIPDEDSQGTFTTTYRRSIAAITEAATKKRDTPSTDTGDDEQPWSKDLPTWTWLIQFLLLGPFTIILTAQSGLLLTDATNQTAVEGSAAIVPYIGIAFYTMLLILPLMPFMHRITYHIPLFLLWVFVGTLIYNLVAFPFSPNNKYKAFWKQTVNLDTGSSVVTFGGVEQYLRLIIADLPSAAGKNIICQKSTVRAGISDCVYDGTDIPPNVANNIVKGIPPSKGYAELVTLDVARGAQPDGQARATFTINAKNTKSCSLKFARPIKRFTVAGGTDWDDRFGPIPQGGIDQILLWRRDWNKTWEVDVYWDLEAATDRHSHSEIGDDGYPQNDELKSRAAEGLDGNITCIWSDINTPGTIPALDEAISYAPDWAVITKLSPGLVEGSKSFLV